VAAIGSMMGLAGAGGEAERGTRMGVWGAAQGVAFGVGGFLGTVAVDLARLVTAEPVHAFAAVFAAEAALFVVGAALALWIEHAPATRTPRALRAQATLHFEPRF
jgi:BCD family chlorophyll transporter-like MFS transporter